jgi:nitrite reductase (NADH) small subunit
VLSRGIVGCRGGVPTVASPMFKQVFDLRTGRCLDDPDRAVAAFAVRRGAGGRVEVTLR